MAIEREDQDLNEQFHASKEYGADQIQILEGLEAVVLLFAACITLFMR